MHSSRTSNSDSKAAKRGPSLLSIRDFNPGIKDGNEAKRYHGSRGVRAGKYFRGGNDSSAALRSNSDRIRRWGGKQSGYGCRSNLKRCGGDFTREAKSTGNAGNGHLIKKQKIMLNSAQIKPSFACLTFSGPRGQLMNLTSQIPMSPPPHMAESRQHQSTEAGKDLISRTPRRWVP